MVDGAMPGATASDVVAEVKKKYGHTVSQNQVYMVRSKDNMAASGKKTAAGDAGQATLSSRAEWIDAIKHARQLLKATGSVDDATAVLKAIGS